MLSVDRHSLGEHTFHKTLLLCSGDSYVDSYRASLSERISLFLWLQKPAQHFQSSSSGWLHIKAKIKIAGDTFPPKIW